MEYIVKVLQGNNRGWSWRAEVWERTEDNGPGFPLPGPEVHWIEGYFCASIRQWNRWLTAMEEGRKFQLGRMMHGVHGHGIVTRIEVPDVLDPSLVVSFVSTGKWWYDD